MLSCARTALPSPGGCSWHSASRLKLSSRHLIRRPTGITAPTPDHSPFQRGRITGHIRDHAALRCDASGLPERMGNPRSRRFPRLTGEYEIRWLLTGADRAAGSSGLQLGVDVPAPVGGRPTVSALLLGTPNTELRWPTPAGAFPLSASNAYRVGDDMEVLLEAEDLPKCVYDGAHAH